MADEAPDDEKKMHIVDPVSQVAATNAYEDLYTFDAGDDILNEMRGNTLLSHKR